MTKERAIKKAGGLSIHDLTRRSTILTMTAILTLRSFNSRPHKEVDFAASLISSIALELSIHDLTRRSTEDVTLTFSGTGLSIHDLTRRST